MSKTHLRLVESDVCYNTTRVVPDTDAQGNEITPEAGGGGGGLPGWLKALLALLVRALVLNVLTCILYDV